MPPAAPRIAPDVIDSPAETATQAPERAPRTKRAMRPRGLVRLGVEGSLSVMSSSRASTIKMATAAVEPMNARREPAKLSQFRCAAEAATAGAVRERMPETTPMAKARKRTKELLMEKDLFLITDAVKK